MRRAGQRYTDVRLSGIAHVDPPIRVPSSEIEDRLSPVMDQLRIRPGILKRMAGVVERRWWAPEVKPSEAAALSAELALENAGVHRDDIGVLINTSVTRDHLEPSTASLTANRMGLTSTVANFDLGNACLGFINGLNVASTMIEHGEIDHGLVVNAECTRQVVEYTIDRLLRAPDPRVFRNQFATLTLGCGSVAAVVSRADLAPEGHAYLGGLGRSATEHARLCTADFDEMRTDAAGLMQAGIEVGLLAWKEAIDAFGWDPDGFDMYAIHQVSAVHTSTICRSFGLDPDRVPLSFPMFGNVGPASVPLVVSQAAADGRLATGDKVMLMGVGSGVNAAAAELVW